MGLNILMLEPKGRKDVEGEQAAVPEDRGDHPARRVLPGRVLPKAQVSGGLAINVQGDRAPCCTGPTGVPTRSLTGTQNYPHPSKHSDLVGLNKRPASRLVRDSDRAAGIGLRLLPTISAMVARASPCVTTRRLTPGFSATRSLNAFLYRLSRVQHRRQPHRRPELVVAQQDHIAERRLDHVRVPDLAEPVVDVHLPRRKSHRLFTLKRAAVCTHRRNGDETVLWMP
jgi:hypothetical protein